MRWEEFQADAGEIGGEARRRLESPGVLLVVTIRRDGTARLSPVEPFFWGGDLWLAMLLQSQKVRDLRRDPRLLVHSIVTDREGAEGEVKMRGSAAFEHDHASVAEVCAAIGAALPYEPDPERVDLARVDVEEVAMVRYVDGDQHVALWPQRRRFVRRETSATSVGDPEELPRF